MPSTSSPANDAPAHDMPAGSRTETYARLDRLDRLADTLDSRFSLFGLRFGWDSILGLIPGVGDVVTVAPAIYTISEAARMGARRRVLSRMALNTGTDFVIGGIPLLGDAFDVFFKSNRRNIALLKAEMARLDPLQSAEKERSNA